MHRYPLIDVMRAAAALLVLTSHVINLGQWPGAAENVWLRGLGAGWVGVDMFFVISGFVIGMSALNAFTGSDPHWRSRFAERRLRRIVPLYFLTCLAFVFLVDPGIFLRGWIDGLQQVGTHLLFVHNLFVKTHGSINGPSWSIALEMQFYLLVALTAGWLVRAPIWQILLAWLGCAALWRFGTTFVLPPGSSNTAIQLIATSQLPGVLDAFGMGIALARLAISGRLGVGWLRFGLWMLAALVLFKLAWDIYWLHSRYWDNAGMIVWWRMLFAAGSVSLLAALVVCPTDGGWLLRPLRYLGQISYGIYLWHMPVLLTLLAATPWREGQLLAGVAGGSVVLAAISWHGFEKLWLTATVKPVPMQAARSL
ncbi:MAG: acyltransferase [Burkholderiaceae bacterium]